MKSNKCKDGCRRPCICYSSFLFACILVVLCIEDGHLGFASGKILENGPPHHWGSNLRPSNVSLGCTGLCMGDLGTDEGRHRKCHAPQCKKAKFVPNYYGGKMEIITRRQILIQHPHSWIVKSIHSKNLALGNVM